MARLVLIFRNWKTKLAIRKMGSRSSRIWLQTMNGKLMFWLMKMKSWV